MQQLANKRIKGDPFTAAFQKRAFIFKWAAEARQIMHERA